MKHSWKVGIIGDFNPKNRSHVAYTDPQKPDHKLRWKKV